MSALDAPRGTVWAALWHRLARQAAVHAHGAGNQTAARYTAGMSAYRPINRLGRTSLFLLGAGLALCAGLAHAQWQWVDDTGRKVFSDTPPPASVPDKNVLRRPHARSTPATPPSAEPQAASTATPATAPPRRDEQLEARKREAEEAEKAKEQAERARIAKIRQENCDRATRTRKTIASGIRMSTTNAKGEIEIMDDKARATEMQRLDRIMAQDCGPMPAAQ